GETQDRHGGRPPPHKRETPCAPLIISSSVTIESTVLVRDERNVMRVHLRRSSVDAGTKPSTFFWWGHSTNQRFSTMSVPVHTPSPRVAEEPESMSASAPSPRRHSM